MDLTCFARQLTDLILSCLRVLSGLPRLFQKLRAALPLKSMWANRDDGHSKNRNFQTTTAKAARGSTASTSNRQFNASNYHFFEFTWGSKMTYQSQLIAAYGAARRVRSLSTTMLAGSFLLLQATPSFATLDNTANAIGTPPLGAPTNYGTSSQSVPVAPAAPKFTMSKSASVPTSALGADNTIVDALDTITYTYTVVNTGNVTMSNVAPTDTGPKFNGTAGTNTLGAFSPPTATIAPGGTQVFTATYVLSQLDVYRAAGIASAVANTAGVTGTTPLGVVYTPTLASLGPTNTATTTIAAGAKLTISKVAVLADTVAPGNTALFADLNETITYTYTVANTGNVAMTNVKVNDLHGTPGVAIALGAGGITNETVSVVGPLGAAASTNTTLNDGIINTLAPGATATR